MYEKRCHLWHINLKHVKLSSQLKHADQVHKTHPNTIMKKIGEGINPTPGKEPRGPNAQSGREKTKISIQVNDMYFPYTKRNMRSGSRVYNCSNCIGWLDVGKRP